MSEELKSRSTEHTQSERSPPWNALWPHIVGNDPHAEAPRDAGRVQADVAGPDDPDCLAVQVKAFETFKRKIAADRAEVGLVHFPGERQDEGEGVSATEFSP